MQLVCQVAFGASGYVVSVVIVVFGFVCVLSWGCCCCDCVCVLMLCFQCWGWHTRLCRSSGCCVVSGFTLLLILLLLGRAWVCACDCVADVMVVLGVSFGFMCLCGILLWWLLL